MSPRIRHVQAMIVAVSVATFIGCSHDQAPLAEYTLYNDTPRYNSAQDYITFLKTQPRFAHGELDHLPSAAIILHGDPKPVLTNLGYTENEWGQPIELGTTDPETLYAVHPKTGAPFIVARGLPGAGGIATETAELAALGVKQLIHIGTSAALGPDLDATRVVISQGAYKDGAAVMLSTSDSHSRIAYPDAGLNASCINALHTQNTPFSLAAGYTIPIYYSQPSGLIRALLTSPSFSQRRPQYIEMEEASFFEESQADGLKAASLTIPADRYSFANGTLVHTFLNDGSVQHSLSEAVAGAISVLQNPK